MRYEFYKDDDDNPTGLTIWHDNLGTIEYDDDHTVMVDFRPELKGSPILQREVVQVNSYDPLTIEEIIECACGFKCKITDGEAVEQ